MKSNTTFNKRTKVKIPFEKQIAQKLSTGATTLIINDNDDVAWCSGFADYCMRNYRYSNCGSFMRFNLTKKNNVHNGHEPAEYENGAVAREENDIKFYNDCEVHLLSQQYLS